MLNKNVISLLAAFCGFLLCFQSAFAAIVTAPVGEPCSEMFNFQDVTYVCADHPTLGKELHVINGDQFGTKVLIDIDAGPGDSSPRAFFEIGGFLYFFAENSLQGESLWRTDGTAEGTQPVRSISKDFGFKPDAIVSNIDNRYFFLATEISEQTPQQDLFQTDGTFDGTRKINVPITRGLQSSLANFAGTTYATLGNSLYLISISSLYRVNSDGTSSLIYQGLPYEPATGPQTILTGQIFDSKLVIRAANEAWLSDGTTNGTRRFRGSVDKPVGAISVVNERFLYVQDLTLRATNGESDAVIWNFESGEYAQAIFQDTTIQNRAVFTQPLVDTPKIVFSGGSENATQQSTGYLLNGFAALDGYLYASDNRGNYPTEPHGIIRIDPITRQQQTLVDGPQLVSIIRSVQQGVVYTACIDRCSPGQLDDRLGLWLLRPDGSTIVLAPIGSFIASAVTNDHQEGQRSYFVVRESEFTPSTFIGIWHSDGTTSGSYRLSYQFDDGQPPVEPETKTLNPSILILLLDDEDE